MHARDALTRQANKVRTIAAPWAGISATAGITTSYSNGPWDTLNPIPLVPLLDCVGALFDTQEFTITVQESGELEISIVSPADYEVDTLLLPPDYTACYTDRLYSFSDAPEYYVGLPFIRTAIRDKNNSSEEFLTFNVNKPVTLYVCYSASASSYPEWLLNNFTNKEIL